MTVTAEKPVPPRPYSRLRNRAERSVTEILSLKSIGGLPWAAARETALFAVHHQDEWAELAPDDAVDRLRKHHRGVWNSRAAKGTATHRVLEAWFAGETVDLAELVMDMAENDPNAVSWRGREEEETQHLVGYVDGLQRWWEDWQPTEPEAEVVVRRPGVYIGTRDLRCRMRDENWLIDLKTTAQQDGDKGIYPESWLWQLTAYDRAPEIVEFGWVGEGSKAKLDVVNVRPNERADRCGILHLRGDGRYTLYELTPTDEDEMAFLAMAHVAHWLQHVPEPVIAGGAA